MIFYREIISGVTWVDDESVTGIFRWLFADSNPDPAKWESDNTVLNIDKYWNRSNMDYVKVRNELIGYNGHWGSLTTDEQKAMVRHHVYPSGTTTTELDALYSQAQRDTYYAQVIEDIKDCGCIIVTSAGGKYFEMITDEQGVLSTTEITPYTILNG